MGDHFQLPLQEKGKATGGNLERVLLPLSSLSGWGLIAVGGLMVMHVLGFNIQPLLTVGGVGGLAVGFGAQTVTSNAISGLNLFLTRPFVVGGRHPLLQQILGSALDKSNHFCRRLSPDSSCICLLLRQLAVQLRAKHP